jgi:peptidoglycan/xylan/chitin deacetylase (PgdA/CDA1 family)
VSAEVVLHGLAGPPGSRLAALLARSGLDRTVADVSGPLVVLRATEAGLPDGPARPEAVAARLRRDGHVLPWGAPLRVDDVPALLARCRRRGRSSLDLVRSDPTLATTMQIGAWFDASWRLRLVRRALGSRSPRRPAALGTRGLAACADLAFWAGVRDGATPSEWRWLTASSYVALVYHRFAGEGKRGQERIDITPARFARQLRALRLAGFRPLRIDDALRFHVGSRPGVPPRSVLLTVDDALADCVAPLRRHAAWPSVLFVPTREVGGTAHWLDGEPVASWDDVRALMAAGVRVGSHARRHRRLAGLDAADLDDELTGSLADLRSLAGNPVAAVAYPYGDHDDRVCAAARAAGMSVGFTTLKGRNGATTDPYRLRRVSIHADDGALAGLWKALAGEGLPRTWLRLRSLRRGLMRRGQLRARSSSS